MLIDDDAVRTAIKAVIVSVDPGARVLNRMKLTLKGKDWHAALRSLAEDGKVNGWMITRVPIRPRKLGPNHFSLEWEYSLMHFRTVRDGTAADNSEKDLSATLDGLVYAFGESPSLGFDSPHTLPGGSQLCLDEHGEFQVEGNDTLNNEVHVVQARLTCFLTKQG